jgi:isopenicillin N synthase-like dioxygenase
MLITKLLECLSLALGLDSEHCFEQYHKGTQYVSSLIHYPAIHRRLLQSGDAVRCPAHSDFGTLTLLFQRDVDGLEIADGSSTDKKTSAAVEKSGRFVPVKPEPGAVVVNIGYLLMRWSNGRWKNTVHRVTEPRMTELMDDEAETVPERYSIAFFANPDAPTTVEPLAQCYNDENPRKWGPINAGEYLLRKKGASLS